MTKLRISVQGCCHGQLNQIYKEVSRIHAKTPIDLLIILGDFQSIRNAQDFKSIAVPPKYQRLGDFISYYNNDLEAPVPTIFIGGNHESMRHLMLLPHGGYAAKNIYYMGYSNVIWFKGIRIGSLSGIWKHWDFNKERESWDGLEKSNWKANIRNLYHVRLSDIAPLFMIKHRIDIMLSHDWPNGVVYHGDIKHLLKFKPFFEQDIQKGDLGNPMTWQLLRDLRPQWWLSAHLHVRFLAVVKHNKRNSQSPNESTSKIKKNCNEIDLDLSSDDETPTVVNNEEKDEPDLKYNETRFLALDKCVPRKRWLEIVEVEPDTEHVSWTDDKHRMFWDPEFINNLTIWEENKDFLSNKPFDSINWMELSKNNWKGEEEIDWENYAIPEYTSDIQKDEIGQTKLFTSKFLT
ncbi:dbr1p [Saccharomyces arboricola H-6]|uniref:Dbr1p n=1 Tax=Saccharomyces arboricola (strain H-6 / AS 2.3317 / CBS 10644) TaxID=1160507 RepID=J8LLI7_SACAR|nr:dbr1p [Saccharomyces arboricola H-6]